jgi:protease secretion system membrane fusion protein
MQNQFNLFKKKGYITIILGFVGFFLWASLYKINQGVYSQGFIVAQNEKIEIISPITGLVDKLNVSSGKIVDEGDIIVFFNESITLSKINAIKTSIDLKEQNLIFLAKQLENENFLVQKEIQNENALLPLKSQISLAKSELEMEKGDYNELLEKIKLLKIKSPVKGSIMNLSITSANINVREGRHLFDIMPLDQNLLASIKIPVNFGNKVNNNMTVDITFPTLIGTNTEKITGNLIYLSADKVNINEEFFFEGKVEIKKEDVDKIKEIKTGLPVTAIIKTGETTMLNYILKPIKDRLNRGIQ